MLGFLIRIKNFVTYLLRFKGLKVASTASIAEDVSFAENVATGAFASVANST